MWMFTTFSEVDWKGGIQIINPIFWLRQELKESQCTFVRSSGPNLSGALNLHLSVSLRSFSALWAYFIG